MDTSRTLDQKVEGLFRLYMFSGVREDTRVELEELCKKIVRLDLLPVYGSEFSHFAAIINMIKEGSIVASADKDYQFWIDRLEIANDNLKSQDSSLQDLLIILVTYRLSLGPIELTHALLEALYNKGKINTQTFTSFVKDNMFVEIGMKDLISFSLPKGFLTIKDIIGENVYENVKGLKKPILDELRYQLSRYHEVNPKTEDSLRTGAVLDTVRLMKYGYEDFYQTYHHRTTAQSNAF